MDGTLWLEVTVAILAVIGLYAVVRWIMGRLFGSQKTVLAIEILTQRDAETAEVLIRDALFQYLSVGAARPIILTTEEWIRHPELCRAASKYGVSCRIIKQCPEERS